MHEIDVDQIMSEIRAEIKAKGYKTEDLSFQDIPIPSEANIGSDVKNVFSPAELLNQINACNRDWNNPMFFPFPGKNPVKKVVQKTVRKVSKCVFWPIVNYQNQFNADVVRALNQFKFYVDADNGKYAALKQELSREVKQVKKAAKRRIEKAKEEIRKVQKEAEKARDEAEEAKREVEEAKKEIVRLRGELDDKVGNLAKQLTGVKWSLWDEETSKSEKEIDIVHCDICGYQAQRDSFETRESECKFNGGKLVRYVCPECGVIFGPTKFMNLSQQEIDEDYKVHYYGFSEAYLLDKELEAFYMLNPNKDGIYLNYGCGRWSKSIQKLREDGYNVYGYEPYAPETDSPYMITNEAELVKMKFDGIYSNDLLEHLIDPIKDLRFMETLLMHPTSQMAHSTACYVYKYEDTRFHTHFFTGNSVEVMSERAGLKIVGYRNAFKERDFICYVFSGVNDKVDYKAYMYVSEYGERIGGSIILHKNGLMCGPYMLFSKGNYRMLFTVTLNGKESIPLKITADKGRKELFTVSLKDGENNVSFSLDGLENNVEFVIYNDEAEDIVVKEISMF